MMRVATPAMEAWSKELGVCRHAVGRGGGAQGVDMVVGLPLAVASTLFTGSSTAMARICSAQSFF